MYCIGIDIGSTASKTAVMREGKVLHTIIMPTAWSSKETAKNIAHELKALGIDVEAENSAVIATGYGRISVPFADKVFSEIKCHGMGASFVYGAGDATVIDIGGQDTKIITLRGGRPTDFLMNDKCSAGTGKFLEIMANRLGLDLTELSLLAEQGDPVTISSMCTVFAESEIISQIGMGVPRENIAAGIVNSVTEKVALLCGRHGLNGACFLTGGLCEMKILIKSLGRKLGTDISSLPLGRYAGAIGAALCAEKI